jgi:hypothetical protein
MSKKDKDTRSAINAAAAKAADKELGHQEGGCVFYEQKTFYGR